MISPVAWASIRALHERKSKFTERLIELECDGARRDPDHSRRAVPVALGIPPAHLKFAVPARAMPLACA